MRTSFYSKIIYVKEKKIVKGHVLNIYGHSYDGGILPNPMPCALNFGKINICISCNFKNILLHILF